MSYQLPQELKTTKLSSLSGDAKKIAEGLVAEKFGIGEVVSSRASSTRPGFENVGSSTIDDLYSRLEIVFESNFGDVHRMTLPISTYDSVQYIDKSRYVDSLIAKIGREIDEFRYRNDYPIRQLRARIDRTEIVITSLAGLRDFIYENFHENGVVS